MDTTPRTNRGPGIQDNFQTPPHAVECLLQYVSTHHDVYHDREKHGGHDVFRSTVVWESAAGTEQLLVRELQAYGFSTIATDIQYGTEYDFFTYDPGNWDIQITNPPFSLKYKWLQRSFELGKPFALLVPTYTIMSGTFAKMFEEYNHKDGYAIEVLSPTRRINFKTPNRGWQNSNAQMHTSWITWGLDIGGRRDSYLPIYYEDIPDIKYDDDNNPIA